MQEELLRVFVFQYFQTSFADLFHNLFTFSKIFTVPMAVTIVEPPSGFGRGRDAIEAVIADLGFRPIEAGTKATVAVADLGFRPIEAGTKATVAVAVVDEGGGGRGGGRRRRWSATIWKENPPREGERGGFDISWEEARRHGKSLVHVCAKKMSGRLFLLKCLQNNKRSIEGKPLPVSAPRRHKRPEELFLEKQTPPK
ncbi:hypothetical protein E3N88_05104 [Mikania micrantha]|uniref:Uncharacterized protein n=1 Tax=Mikania micrantha TaxID=192012 RepID=A0A5N6PY65_9ASTR|nr:hypothetical protein E3N88_05104 [Mikania micrantha]